MRHHDPDLGRDGVAREEDRCRCPPIKRLLSLFILVLPIFFGRFLGKA
jgi:hypothetical protein